MTKSIPSILFATLFATTLGFAQDTESLLDLARGEAAKEGSTPALVCLCKAQNLLICLLLAFLK